MLRRAPWILVLLAAAALSIGSGAVGAEGETPPYEEGVSPVYLIVSLAPEFDVSSRPGEEQSPSEVGSPTVLLNIGTFLAGGGILDARFASASLSTLPLPEGTSPVDLEGNAATVLGSFVTMDTEEIHMVTAAAGFIPADIQFAVFEASRLGDLDFLGGVVDGVQQFPTTYAIASVIAGRLPEGSEHDVGGVLDAVFGTSAPLEPGDGTVVAVESEGDLFPHQPNGAKLFGYAVEITVDGDVTADVCLAVSIDVKPGSDTNPVNRRSQGRLPVAVLSTSSFDATEFADADLRLEGVSAVHVAVEDVDGDGLDDLICHFRIPQLLAAGALDLTDTTLTLEAVLEDGSCIEGTDDVLVMDP